MHTKRVSQHVCYTHTYHYKSWKNHYKYSKIFSRISEKIQNKRLQIDQSAVSVVPPSEASAGEVVINQSADNSEEEEEEQEQEVKPKGGSSILLDLMEVRH